MNRTLVTEYTVAHGYRRIYDRDQASAVAEPCMCEECGKRELHQYHGFRHERGQIVSISRCSGCGHESEY